MEIECTHDEKIEENDQVICILCGLVIEENKTRNEFREGVIFTDPDKYKYKREKNFLKINLKIIKLK